MRYEIMIKVTVEADNDPMADELGNDICEMIEGEPNIESVEHEWPEVLYD